MNKEAGFWHKLNTVLQAEPFVILTHCGSAYQQRLLACLAEKRSVVDFASPALRERALLDAKTLAESLPMPCLLMHVPCAPQLLRELAARAAAGGSIVIAADQTYYLREQLAAEAAVFVKLPVWEERQGALLPWAALDGHGKADGSGLTSDVLLQNILQGGLAGRYLSDAEREEFFAAYLHDFLQNNIRAQTVVSDEVRFYRFLCRAAAESGNFVSYTDLAKAADISSPTAKVWLELLVQAGIVWLLPALRLPQLQRAVRMSKLCFSDTGLAAYLLDIDRQEQLLGSMFFGALFESYVLNVIYNNFLTYGTIEALSCFRDSNAKEISLVIRHGDKLYPIDIKAAAVSGRRTARKFRLLQTAEKDGLSLGQGGVIGFGRQQDLPDDGLWYLSAESL